MAGAIHKGGDYDMEVSKADWKLFQERIPEWQERNMERLNREYVALLTGEGEASEKFWALEKRISRDRRSLGVQIQPSKSNMKWDIWDLLNDGIISTEDLAGFSDELREEIISSFNGRLTFDKFDFSKDKTDDT